MIFLRSYYIPVLIASTGSNLEAIIAGAIPAIRPIAALTLVPRIIFEEDKIKVKSSVATFAINVPSQTNRSPKSPPKSAKIMDSNKN